MVLRLVPYLVKNGIFREVNFILLVVGHTKNDADRFFNILKMKYRNENFYSMDMLIDVLSSSKSISVHCVDSTKDFHYYDEFLGSYYRCYPKIDQFSYPLLGPCSESKCDIGAPLGSTWASSWP